MINSWTDYFIEVLRQGKRLDCNFTFSNPFLLAATDYGIGTCIALRPVYWPNMLRELLGIPQSELILIDIAIGYSVPEARINNFERQRIPLESRVKEKNKSTGDE